MHNQTNIRKFTAICLMSVILIALIMPGCLKRRRRTSPALSKLPQRDGVVGLYQGVVISRDPENNLVTVELLKKSDQYSDLPIFKVKRHIGDQFTFEDFATAPALGEIPLKSEVEFQCREELPIPSFVKVFWGKAAAAGQIVPGY